MNTNQFEGKSLADLQGYFGETYAVEEILKLSNSEKREIVANLPSLHEISDFTDDEVDSLYRLLEIDDEIDQKRICIQVDFNQYDIESLKEILSVEFDDEFEFEIENVENKCIALDYVVSSFEREYDAQKALQRVNNVLEFAEFEN